MSITIGLIAGSLIKGLVSKYGDKTIDYAIDFFSEKGKEFIIEKGKEKLGEIADDTFDEFITNPIKTKIINILTNIKGKPKKEINDLIFEELKNNLKLTKKEFNSLNLKLDKIEEKLGSIDYKLEQLLDKRLEDLFEEKLREIKSGAIKFTPSELFEFDKKIKDKLDKTKFDVAINYIYEKNDIHSAKKILYDIYTNSSDKDIKIKCILAIIATHRDPSDNEEILDLIEKGLELCKDLKFKHSEISLRINKLKINYVTLYYDLVEHNLSYEMALKSGSVLAFYDTSIQEKITEKFMSEFKEIDKELLKIFELGNDAFYSLFLNLPTLIMNQIYNATNRKTLGQEFKEITYSIKNLANISIEISSSIKDKEIKYYFYNILCQAYSIEENKDELIKTAKIMLDSTDLKDVHLKKLAIEYLESAYKEEFIGKFEHKPFEKLSPSEIKVLQDKAIETMLKRYGINPDLPGQENELVKMALNDMEPTQKMKFCKHLKISQLSISEMGRLLVIPTLGRKSISCSIEGKGYEDLNLDLLFNSFKSAYCKTCEKREKRENDWKFESIGLSDYYKFEK